MAQPKLRVDIPITAHINMASHWRLIRALNGGTPTMRADGEEWLPKEEGESRKQYNVRLERTFLYNGYHDSVRRIVSRPFAKPVTVQNRESLHEQLFHIQDDVDKTGQDLTQFGRDLMTSGIDVGLVHAVVDYPKVAKDASLAEQREFAIRPTFIMVEAWQLLGWTVTYPTAGGAPVLTSIRFIENRTVPVDEYTDTEITCIRVITQTGWSLFRKDSKGDWFEFDSGEHTFGAVPLVTCYINRTGFMTAVPPMEDLAWMNLRHWQSSSDQNNILRIARVPMLLATGFTAKEAEGGIVASAQRVVRSKNKEAKLTWVEHSGKAIEAGEQDLRHLEERMETLGSQPLVSRSAAQTATAKAIDETKNQSDVEAWIRSVENCLVQCYEYAAKWVDSELSEDFNINIFSDFVIGTKVADDIKALQADRDKGNITHKTYLEEAKRRNLYSETLNIEAEIEAVQQEENFTPDMGVTGGEVDEDGNPVVEAQTQAADVTEE